VENPAKVLDDAVRLRKLALRAHEMAAATRERVKRSTEEAHTLHHAAEATFETAQLLLGGRRSASRGIV
jgi:hypothetical protein